MNMKTVGPNEELVDFVVEIPTPDGSGVADRIPIKVPARRSVSSGEMILTAEALDLIEQTQARHMGLMTPDEIAALRKRLRKTQKEMAELLQAGEKSYTRWETGRSRPSRLVNIVLCAMRDTYLPVEYLRRLNKDGNDWRTKLRECDAAPDEVVCVIPPEMFQQPETRTDSHDRATEADPALAAAA